MPAGGAAPPPEEPKPRERGLDTVPVNWDAALRDETDAAVDALKTVDAHRARPNVWARIPDPRRGTPTARATGEISLCAAIDAHRIKPK